MYRNCRVKCQKQPRNHQPRQTLLLTSSMSFFQFSRSTMLATNGSSLSCISHPRSVCKSYHFTLLNVSHWEGHSPLHPCYFHTWLVLHTPPMLRLLHSLWHPYSFLCFQTVILFWAFSEDKNPFLVNTSPTKPYSGTWHMTYLQHRDSSVQAGWQQRQRQRDRQYWITERRGRNAWVARKLSGPKFPGIFASLRPSSYSFLGSSRVNDRATQEQLM